MRILTAVLLASVPLGPLYQPASADETSASTGIRVVSYSPLRRTEVVGLVGEPTTLEVRGDTQAQPVRIDLLPH